MGLAIPGAFLSAVFHPAMRALPCAYPLYYVLLFVPRHRDDDVIFRKKYGDKVWDAYVKRVPWRIVPWVY